MPTVAWIRWKSHLRRSPHYTRGDDERSRSLRSSKRAAISETAIRTVGCWNAVEPPPIRRSARGRHRESRNFSQIRFFYPHDSRGVVAALGASRCADAMDLLLELAKPDGSACPQIGDEWITAVAQLGGKRSNEVLLSFVDPSQKLFTKEFIPDFQNGDVLARLLADRAEREDAFKTELFRLANGDLPLGKRGLLARTFAHFRREDLVAGLCVLRDDTNDFRGNCSSQSRTHSWKDAHTGWKHMSTPSRPGDRMPFENAFSRWCKQTPCGSVQHLLCSARSKCGGSNTVAHGGAATSRDRVGH